MLAYSTPLKPNWPAPDFLLFDTRGEKYRLYEQKPKKGILVIFTCNHCLYAKASWPVLVKLFEKYHSQGIDFVAINSNDSISYPEDSLEGMKKMVNKLNLPFAYLRDEDQEVAKSYQVQCTPDLYLLNKEKKLYYHGRINDNWQNPSKIKRDDLNGALNRLVISDKPPVEQFPSMGCSIKWK